MTKQGNLTGIFAPTLTPYDALGNVNYEELSRLAKFITDKGTHGIFISGTSGEFVNQTIDERKKMLSCVREAIQPDKKILFNITAMNLKDLEELTEYARKEKIQSVSVTAPYYHRYDAKTLVEYFYKVAEMTEGLDLYLYNMEGMTGNPITPKILKNVVEKTRNIKGIKDSSMDFMRILEYQAIIDNEEFELITGNDAQILTTLQADCAGAVVVFASVVPEICMDIWNKYQAGNIKEAKEAQNKILEMRNLCREIMPIMSHKHILKMQGFQMGGGRFPFRNLTAEEEQRIEKRVRELNII